MKKLNFVEHIKAQLSKVHDPKKGFLFYYTIKVGKRIFKEEVRFEHKKQGHWTLDRAFNVFMRILKRAKTRNRLPSGKVMIKITRS